MPSALAVVKWPTWRFQTKENGRIAASTKVVEEVLAEVQGYGGSQQNCPSQTVIAGASDAVEAASEAFKSRGITVYPLPVSHAFHSSIVAPASEPLKKVLERLNVRAPKRPITTNVTSGWYPTGEGAEQMAIDNLAKQVAAPVEWTAQMERMYDEGARIFVECGPKRALTGFTVAILKKRPHRALHTNHPKTGELRSFMDALAGLITLGFPVKASPGTQQPDLLPLPNHDFQPATLKTDGDSLGMEANPEVLAQIQKHCSSHGVDTSNLIPIRSRLTWESTRAGRAVAGL